MSGSRRVVIVGAGIAGIAVAYRLATKYGLHKVTLVDPRPPLTLTSDKSTECYRNWWPNRPMVGLMNRSIDLLEEMAKESDNTFGLSRRGYLFVTADQRTFDTWKQQAHQISKFGAGPVRSHPGPVPYRRPAFDSYQGQPEGVDLLESETLREHFPYLTESAFGALHVRRAGWLSAQQLGAWMLDEAKSAGMTHLIDEVVSITTSDDRVVGIVLASGSHLDCDVVVNAAGPMSPDVAAMVGLDLPLRHEVHLKVAFRDHLGVVPRDAPMVIWSDPQTIAWGPEEREALAEAGRRELTDPLPIYCHGRPEGGADSRYFVALWEYHGQVQKPVWPLPPDDLYPEVVMRGLATMVPELNRYRDGLPKSVTDGGYYTKTEENRPLIGPAGPDGFYLACGYSGFGVMVASGAADLVSRHVMGADLPPYAADFELRRYDDPTYLAAIRDGVESGQL